MTDHSAGIPEAVIEWLLDSDPAIRWQVMRDLTNASGEEVAAERVKVATEGWGTQLLALQGADGSWAGTAWGGKPSAETTQR